MNVKNSKTMRRVVMSGAGGPDVLAIAEAAVPQAKPHEVLIEVEAAGVNRPDVLQREGAYPPPPGASPHLGLEIAGTIVEIGQDVSGWNVGDKVCALVDGGGYADFCAAPAGQCLPIPGSIDFVGAAALPEACFTVWSNVFSPQRGNLKPGETFLVHGGTSGIGTTSIQVATAFGAEVIATAGTDEKCAACLALGAHAAINYRTQDFVAETKRLTGGRGVDVILDMVGGDTVARNVASLAREGRLVFIAFMQGSRVDLDLMPIMLKRLRVTGSTMRAQSASQKADIAAAIRQTLWPHFDHGRCAPQVFATFPLGNAAEAHRLMESNTHIGKIVLRTKQS
jgi:NADPH2:quinone reductase